MTKKSSIASKQTFRGRWSASVRPSYNFIQPCRSLTFDAAFTIIELLVVIVIIGILAAITIVSYVNIANKANIALLQSDLSNAAKKLNIYYTLYGVYPATMPNEGTGNYCPSSPTVDNNYCIRASNGNIFSYSVDSINGFSLFATKDHNTYSITKDTSPTPWVTIDSQVWASANLNVGTMITGVTAQTDNSVVEKYCYDNLGSNCATYGALYQWNEAMNYAATEGARGICPAGSHIPTDSEWKTLEMQLGMSQAQADLVDVWRGTDQGTQLKVGGSSGLNLPLAGYRSSNDGSSSSLLSSAELWSSSVSSPTSAWDRYLTLDQSGVTRDAYSRSNGFSVRCLKG